MRNFISKESSLPPYSDRILLLNTSQEVFDYHFPSGTSFRNFIHWAQNVNEPKLRMFNHGKKVNKEVYGVGEPPVYDLTRIMTPVFVFIGSDDWLSTTADSIAAANEMKNVQIQGSHSLARIV